MLPKINQFSYGQVTSYWGSGQFLQELNADFGDEDKVVSCEINDRDEVLGALKTFLGKGR